MRVILLALFIITVVGCTNRNKIPSGILSQKEMREVLWDVMQVNEYAQNYIANDTLKNYKKERTILYQQVFDLHKVSRPVFNKSFDYYMSRPDLTQAIFDTLAAQQAQQRAEEMRLQDSARVREERKARLLAKDSLRRDTSQIKK